MEVGLELEEALEGLGVGFEDGPDGEGVLQVHLESLDDPVGDSAGVQVESGGKEVVGVEPEALRRS